MMDRAGSTRLATLQDDAKQGTKLASETLTIADLLLLLREDSNVRTLIRDIVAMPLAVAVSDERDADGVADHQNTPPDHRAGALVFPATEPTSPPVDTLREQLRPELVLLKLVRADPDLAAEWLGEQTDEGRQLLQLVACAAQWDVLADLWDKLASRCKQAQRVASADELYILQTSLALHNLRWRGRQARLVEVAAGTAYDYERHQRGTTTGDCVRVQWLPGLVNAGGQLQKKPLVQT
jgi:hypothetical protein